VDAGRLSLQGDCGAEVVEVDEEEAEKGELDDDTDDADEVLDSRRRL